MRPSTVSTAIFFVLGLLLHFQVHEAQGDDASILTLTDHTDVVYSVAITPDGSKIVSGSADHTVKIWNLANGTLTNTLTGHTNVVTNVAITPDGSKIVSQGGDDSMKIWNLADGTLINSFSGYKADFIAVTPDSLNIVTGAYKYISYYNISNGFTINTWTADDIWVYSVAVSPDGSKTVSGGSDSTVKIWNLSDGSLIRALSGHYSGVTCVAISPDGSKIVSGSFDRIVRIWNFSDGAPIQAMIGHTSFVNSVAITSDGLKIVSGSFDTTIKTWNLSDGALTCTLHGHTNSVDSVAVTHDGSKAVSGSDDTTIKIWNLSDTSQCFTQSQSQSQTPLSTLTLTPGISQADWYGKKKSQGFGYKVALLYGIAAISVPFCFTSPNTNTCDGGSVLTYKYDYASKLWKSHKRLINPLRYRDNRFGHNLVLNEYYLIVSAPKSNYVSTDVGILVFYRWSYDQETFLKESIIRYRKTTKNFELGASISNIDSITAIGMPTYDTSTNITNSGCAHVYRKKDNGLWGNRYTITVSNPKTNYRFGHSLSLGDDTLLAVSNNPDDVSDQAVFIYFCEDGEWNLFQVLSDNKKLGFGWKIEFKFYILFISAVNDGTYGDNVGSVTLYYQNGNEDIVPATVITPEVIVNGSHFGYSFDFSIDGYRLVVGSKPCNDNEACNIKGSAHVFVTDNGFDWFEYFRAESPVADGSDGYGHDVAAYQDTIMVSAPFDSTGSLPGKVYFVRK